MFSTLATAGAHLVGPMGGFHWAFLLIPVFWVLLFVLLAATVGRRWRRAAWGGYGHGHGHGYGAWGASAARNAESTLAERFAQGDIDEKEYRARLEVLRANAFPTPPAK